MRCERARDGVALIVVLFVLAALAVISVPFLISMSYQERDAARFQARARARMAAEAARDHAIASLVATHAHAEREKAEREERGTIRDRTDGRGRDGRRIPVVPPSPQDVDGLDEIAVDLPPALGTIATRDPKGTMLEASVADEQGKIHLDTAPPILLGNLLGSSYLSAEVDATAKELRVASSAAFRTDGDPATIDGLVAILDPRSQTYEVASYRHIDGDRLLGVERGEYISIARRHSAGSPVFDLRGLKASLNGIYARRGALVPFGTMRSLRQIGEWSIVSYFLDRLWAHRVAPETVARAGVKAGALVPPGLRVPDLTSVDPLVLRSSEETLRAKGFPEDVIDRIGRARGPRGVVALAEALAAASEDEARDELAKVREELGGEPDEGRSTSGLAAAARRLSRLWALPAAETLSTEEFEGIRDLVTVSSVRPAAWSQAQPILGVSNHKKTGVQLVFVRDTSSFNPGAIVRVTGFDPGGTAEYRRVAGAVPLVWEAEGEETGTTAAGTTGGVRVASGSTSAGSRGDAKNEILRNLEGYIILESPIGGGHGDGRSVIQVALRHPVNINTAPRAVLRAVWTGLRLNGSTDFVKPVEAANLVDFVEEALPLGGHAAFREVLERARSKDLITSDDVQAILTNAVNPNHRRLAVSTTGFTYRAMEVASIEATGIVNDPAGREIARARFREIVQFAPLGTAWHILESQDDFTYRVFLAAPPNRSAWRALQVPIPGRAGRLVISEPRIVHGQAWGFPGSVPGILTGITAESPRLRGTVAIEHFPRTNDGLYLEAGQAHVVGDERARAGGIVAAGAANASGRSNEGPFLTTPLSIDFWVKPRWGSRSGRRVFFDVAADPGMPYQNRATLYFDGASQEIVLEVRDDTLPWWRAQDGEPPAAGVRWRANAATFADDVWYHIGAHWTGTWPGEQALLVDGRMAGRGNLTTELAAPLAASATTLTVRDEDVASRFPPRGALLVGSEAISYISRQGTTFTVRPRTGMLLDGRGARGTVRRSHLSRTPVSLFGYSIPVERTDLGEGFSTGRYAQGNAPTSRQRRSATEASQRILLGAGGAQLSMPLGIPKRIRVDEKWQASAPEPSTRSVIRLSLQNHPEFATLPASIPAGPIDPVTLGFQPRGYIFVTFLFSDAANVGSAFEHHEIIRYSTISSFQGGELSENLVGYQFGGLQRGMLGTTPPPAGAGAGTTGGGVRGGQPIPRGTSGAIAPTLAPGAAAAGAGAAGAASESGGGSAADGAAAAGAAGESQYGLALSMTISGMSIETNQTDLEQRYPPSGLVQIDRRAAARPVTPYLQEVEWIRYTAILEGKYFVNDPHVGGWTGSTWQSDGAIFRGWTGNSRYGVIDASSTVDGRPLVYLQADYEVASIGELPGGSPIVPVFRISRPGPEPDDRISISEQGGEAAERRFETKPRRVRIVAETDVGIFVSLYEPLETSYRETRDVRLKMFPSGELPTRGTQGIVFGQDAAGGKSGSLDGIVDEIRVSQPMSRFAGRFFGVPSGSAGFRMVRGGEEGAGGGGDSAAAGAGARGAVDTSIAMSAEVRSGGAADRLVIVSPGFEGGQTGWMRGESLLAIGREVFFGRQVENQTSSSGTSAAAKEARASLAQPLSRDHLLDQGDEAAKIALAQSTRRGYPVPPRSARDLRSEIIPQILITAGTGIPDRDGYVEIEGGSFGGEVVYYERRGGGALVNCLRGQLGTPIQTYPGYMPEYDQNLRKWRRREVNQALRSIPRVEIDLLQRGLLASERIPHELGERFCLPLETVPAALLLGPVTERSVAVSSRQGFPSNGYVLVDDGRIETPDEIIAYVGLGPELLATGAAQANARTALHRAVEDRRERGIFRGSFGTEPLEGFGEDIPVIALPFRNYDRYEPRAESYQIQLFESAYTSRGAYWKRLTWELDPDEKRWPRHEVRIVVRLDGEPAWDAEATNKPGGLYIFTDPEGDNRIDRVADTIEIRVYFRYLPGAYGRLGPEVYADDWKMSPRIRDIVVEYENPTRILEHDELVP
ncbi:MAG: hypothetical protein JXP34_04295 [Planctomycetes bacterium]|nr:hypothetical protein [Planctomycetota bacterium]